MAKRKIKYETIPIDEIPIRSAVPSDWLEQLEQGNAVVVDADARSAIYQRFRKEGIKIKTTKIEGKLYITLA